MKAMREDLHVLTGSYVLDAISDTEREEFERHLQHCPACEAEVRGMRETAARLALACAVTAPARMEQQVLAATYRTRQLPPLPADRPGRAMPRLVPRVPRRPWPHAGPAQSAAPSWPAAAWPRPQITGFPESAQHSAEIVARATAIARVAHPPRLTRRAVTARRGAAWAAASNRGHSPPGGAARGRGRFRGTVVDGIPRRPAALARWVMSSGPALALAAYLGCTPRQGSPAGPRSGPADRIGITRARGRHGPPDHHPRRGPARLGRRSSSITPYAISACGIAWDGIESTT